MYSRAIRDFGLFGLWEHKPFASRIKKFSSSPGLSSTGASSSKFLQMTRKGLLGFFLTGDALFLPPEAAKLKAHSLAPRDMCQLCQRVNRHHVSGMSTSAPVTQLCTC